MNKMVIGKDIYNLAVKLWPINRSITGEGVRRTLKIIQEYLPDLIIHEVPSGSAAFDWIVPDEWNVNSAWVDDEYGNRIIDFEDNNLHLVGYSIPVDAIISLNELQEHLHSLPDLPNTIPYVTSYYNRTWGFCLSDNLRKSLKDCSYHVVVNSTLKTGHLTYGELVIPGLSKQEVLISTYICHPSMANNELSGPCVVTFLVDMIKNIQKRFYTYRIVFIPETIGSIVYLSQNLIYLKNHVVAGYVVTCVGDNRCYSYLPSRNGNTISDLIAKHTLKYIDSNYKNYSYLDRGSDERQYCFPGIDLPIASVMRSKYDCYPEYHTSDDNLSIISPEGLEESYLLYSKIIQSIENNFIPKVTTICEPQLGKRGLYPPSTAPGYYSSVKLLCDLIAYSDGSKCLVEIANIFDIPVHNLIPICRKLIEEGLLIDMRLDR